jgi:hypothetical protein
MKTFIAFLAGAILAAAGFLVFDFGPRSTASPGPDVYNTTNFRAGVVAGGNVISTSSVTAATTFLNTDLIQKTGLTSLINFTPNVTGITATLPASSTLKDLAPVKGDKVSMALCNATTTAATTFTFAVGAGETLDQATSTLAIPTGQCAKLDFLRTSTSDFRVFYDLFY